MISSNQMLQIYSSDIRPPCPCKRYASPDISDDHIDWRRERFAFELDPQVLDNLQTNTSIDDCKYFGSKFIADWLLSFAEGDLKVKFESIFTALIDGIRIEGCSSKVPIDTMEWLIAQLEHASDIIRNKNDVKRMKTLSKCCAKLYTKNCFLFRLVNITLRDDDRTKLSTLGPYCYLVYNYTCQRAKLPSSIRRRRLLQTHTPPLLVYRGDFVSNQRLSEYKQAAKQRNKYFKWLSFVSTSCQRDVGESFATNVLYEIELKGATSNDQFVDLRHNSFLPDEEEVLLRPGVRFYVENVTRDSEKNLHVVRIKIVPSYISYLK